MFLRYLSANEFTRGKSTADDSLDTLFATLLGSAKYWFFREPAAACLRDTAHDRPPFLAQICSFSCRFFCNILLSYVIVHWLVRRAKECTQVVKLEGSSFGVALHYMHIRCYDTVQRYSIYHNGESEKGTQGLVENARGLKVYA